MSSISLKSACSSLLPLIVLAICTMQGRAQQPVAPGQSVLDGLVNGVPWFDDRGEIVNAHGACIVQDQGRYYLFGEYKTDSVNRFVGFSCYSSADLVHWKFESLALPELPDGLLGPGRIGERAKVMRCPQTGEYIMLMHADNMQYKDPCVAYATSASISGPYSFKGPLLYQGKPIRKWDMGSFQDSDGQGYLLVHHGDIYRLSADYKTAEEKVASNISGAGESPALFKKDNVYYLLSSNLTSWERNDNHYHTAASLAGPWQKQGLFCPPGTLTYNSQCSFVLPIVGASDTLFMYMGDRWSFPKQAQAATQVWLPLEANAGKLSIPQYVNAWHPLPGRSSSRKAQPIPLPQNTPFISNRKEARLTLHFTGETAFIYGHTNAHGGYARVLIRNRKGKVFHDSFIDFYSKVPERGMRFVSRKLPKDHYELVIEVSGEHGVWYKKDGTRFGSDDYYVHIDEVSVL